MIFISVFVAIDAIFIARFAGSTALAGLNIASPLYSVAFGFGIMFATGGGALIGIKLGKGKQDEAKGNFTTLTIAGASFGLLATIICLLFRAPLLSALGARGEILPYAMTYSLYLILAFTPLILKVILETIIRIDGAPKISLFVGIIGGMANIFLDYIFMGPLHMGIAGAGLGTLLGMTLSAIAGFWYFKSAKSTLKFKRGKLDMRFLLSSATNGSSEMVHEVAIGMMMFVFNMLTLNYLGTNGVAAITIILSLQLLITSIFIGFSMGVSPLISYNYGSGNHQNIIKITSYAKRFVLIGSIIMFAIVTITAKQLVGIYTDPSNVVYDIAVKGLQVFSIGFLFAGINIFASAFFTAFGNGKISAMISFLKSFVLFLIAAVTLPRVLGSDGIWLITPITEFTSIFIVIFFMVKYKYLYTTPQNVTEKKKA
jgi:putative MATE family efflux protein